MTGLGRVGRWRVSAWLVAVVVAAAGGCSPKPRTEIVLGIATDLEAPDPLATVDLEVRRLPEDIPIGSATFDISGRLGSDYEIPATYAVYSESGTADRIRVILTARDGAKQRLVVRTAVMNLVPERTLFVRLGVVSACRGKFDCAVGDTCVEGRCVTEQIDSSRLPVYTPGAEKEVTCSATGAAVYVNTGSKQPLPATGTTCRPGGTCQEGVCLQPPVADAGTGGDGTVEPTGPTPQLTLVAPATGTAGTSTPIELRGPDIAPGWSIVFDGTPVVTTVEAGTGGQIARGTLTIPLSIPTGQVPLWLQGGSRRSNTLYFTVTPAPGAPLIVDYTPDNAMIGASILIIGSSFGAGVTVKDPLGRDVPVTAMSTTTWVGQARETLAIDIPAGMTSGPFTATNANGSFRGRIFNIGENLSRLAGATATASTQYNTGIWSIASGTDNNLQSSWFAAHGDCATIVSCTTVPFFQIAFPTPQTVARIAIRGNREYASGYDFVEGWFEVLDANGASLWKEQRALPDPDRDLDVILPVPMAGVGAVKFTSITDQSDEPGFSELEVFGP